MTYLTLTIDIINEYGEYLVVNRLFHVTECCHHSAFAQVRQFDDWQREKPAGMSAAQKERSDDVNEAFSSFLGLKRRASAILVGRDITSSHTRI